MVFHYDNLCSRNVFIRLLFERVASARLLSRNILLFHWLWGVIRTAGCLFFPCLCSLILFMPPPPQALCGCTVTVPTLDGRTITVTIRDVVKPGTKTRITGEGLPLSKCPEKRGDLVLQFEVAFPERLSQGTRDALSQVLPP